MGAGPSMLGKTGAEKLAEESTLAREIVKQITVDLQVTQRQILLIIHGLALNLDDVGAAQKVAGVVREIEGLFLVDRTEEGHGG